ncbi:zinc finger protein 600 [Calliphora vicina]|uniref:zinc finger protein 600 n=1 Tax=Calliphora vicina TaxID=7373 RepID=UPI00325AAFF1
MAVNVSTSASVCLYCKTTSEKDAEKEFHEIYDEVGVELQLPTLIEKFFHINVINDNKHTLCDDCVNRLIELYDLEEHAKEEKHKVDDFTELQSPGATIVEPEGINKEKSEEGSKQVYEKFTKEVVDDQYKLKCTNNLEQDEAEIFLQNKEAIHHAGLEIVTEPNDTANVEENEYTEDVEGVISKDNSAIFTDQDIPNNNAENFTSENFEIGLDQCYNNIICNSPVSVTNASEPESNEDIVFVEDQEDFNSDIENDDNSNIIGNQISAEELEVLNDTQIHAIIEDEQVSEIGNETFENNCIYIEQSDIEEHVYEDEVENEALSDFSTNNSQNEENQLQPIVDIQVEGNELVYYEEDLSCDNEKECLNEILDELENDNIELNSLDVETENSVDIKTESLNSNHNDTGNKIIYRDDIDVANIIENDEEDVDDPQDDTYSIEEEYLMEEINCSQEFDCVDVNEYLEKVLVTKFQDLQLDWKVECKLCHDKYNTFQEVLNHECITQFEEEQQFSCIIKDCGETMNNLQNLSRHLILQHYDKLESIPIYGKCPDCQKTFSNFIDFNKHSCCRTIKRKTGAPNYCQSCDLDFQSLKRFVFHMQFHLTNHRPKVCLLCGKLFNNSNDFFEHTQYEHNPNADMACIICDRFFKEKDVFDSHMDLHEDLKYQFACKYCPKKYTNKYGLNLHMDIYHNKSKSLKCDHCEKEFVNNSSYRNHLKSHAADVQVEAFICATCGLMTSNSELIKEHTESNEESSCYSSEIEEKILGLGYTCENCSIDFHTIKQLQQHRLSDKHSDELFHCGVCRRAFKTLRHMRNHSISHKDYEKWQQSFPITRYFVCNVGDCQEFYPIWTSLYYHKKRPHKTKENIDKPPTEFKCQFCQQLCSSKMSLAVHVARSHNNSNISCPHCKQTYKSQKLLQDHIDKYHVSIKCNICFKSFKNRRNLDSHSNLVHLNVKRYFCRYCNKGYFHKSEMEIHEKKVHPEFAYKCEICDFITNYAQSLEIHMDKHNNKQKFKCTICSKAFGRKQLLQVHMKRHQNKKDYVCSQYLTESGCDAAFFTYNLLKIHIQTKHKKDSNNKRKILSSKKYVVEIEDKSYEIFDIDEDSSSTQVKRPRITSVMRINNDEFEEDALELALEKELESQEQKSDDEYETICD